MYQQAEHPQFLHHVCCTATAAMPHVLSASDMISKSNTKAAVRARQLRWLSDLETWTGKSLSRIATEAQLSNTTLTRFKHPDYAGTLADVTVAAIVAAHGVPGPGNEAAPPGKRHAPLREHAHPYDPQQEHDLHVRGAVEGLLAGRNDVEPLILQSRSLEGAGYLPGDVVILAHNASPRDGDAVCASVVDWKTGRSSTIWRVFREAGALDVLVPASRDPAVGEILIVDGEKVSILGVIDGAVRPRRAA